MLAMWEACTAVLPPRTSAWEAVQGIKRSDEKSAVFELCKLIEVLWRIQASRCNIDDGLPAAQILKELRSSKKVPKEIADAGFSIIHVRNRIAHVPSGKNVPGSVSWQDLLATLAGCHKVLDWASKDSQLFHALCFELSGCKSEGSIVASTPPDDWLNYTIRSVQRNEIEEIVRIDRSVYDPVDIVPVETVQSWWDADPECLTCIEYGGDHLSGYFCMLFLRPLSLDRLINGTLQEKFLRGKDLFRCSDLRSPRDAYISSIVVQNRYSALTPLLIQHMSHRFEWLHRAGILRRVYAIAATSNGEKLVKRFEFSLVKDAECTADHHPLYMLDMAMRRGI